MLYDRYAFLEATIARLWSHRLLFNTNFKTSDASEI